jgi:hypothetical protein
MVQPHLTSEEVVRRGKELYEQQIRAKVEAGNKGKFLIINVETGEYEMDDDRLAASDRAAARFPGAALYAMRIGFPTMGRIGLGFPAGRQ